MSDRAGATDASAIDLPPTAAPAVATAATPAAFINDRRFKDRDGTADLLGAWSREQAASRQFARTGPVAATSTFVSVNNVGRKRLRRWAEFGGPRCAGPHRRLAEI